MNYLLICLIIVIGIIILFLSNQKNEYYKQTIPVIYDTNFFKDGEINIPYILTFSDKAILEDILPQLSLNTLKEISNYNLFGNDIVDKYLLGCKIKSLSLLLNLTYFTSPRYEDLLFLHDLMNIFKPNSSIILKIEDDFVLIADDLFNNEKNPVEVGSFNEKEFRTVIKLYNEFVQLINMRDYKEDQISGIRVYIGEYSNLFSKDRKIGDLFDLLGVSQSESIVKNERIKGRIYEGLLNLKIYNSEQGFSKFINTPGINLRRMNPIKS